jgi:hypothetical protein
MNGWSEALRQELQPDIRVTVIEPGAVATELTNHITDPAAKQGAEQLYQELAITAEDVAEVIAFAVTRPPADDAERDPPPTHRANRLISQQQKRWGGRSPSPPPSGLTPRLRPSSPPRPRCPSHRLSPPLCFHDSPVS